MSIGYDYHVQSFPSAHRFSLNLSLETQMTLKERLIFVSSEPFLCISDHHPAETTNFPLSGTEKHSQAADGPADGG